MTLITERTYQQNKCLANTQHENKNCVTWKTRKREARKEKLKQKDRERERDAYTMQVHGHRIGYGHIQNLSWVGVRRGWIRTLIKCTRKGQGSC